MASRRPDSATRAAAEQVLEAVGSRLCADGFAVQEHSADVGTWERPVPALPLTRVECFVGLEPVDGGLEIAFHARLNLLQSFVDQHSPVDVRRWWTEFGRKVSPAALFYASHRDLPSDRMARPMEGVDLTDSSATVNDVVFATLDQVVLPRVAQLSTAEALAVWASTPQVYGRFHGGIVRSCVVELCLLGRGDLVPGVVAAFERGPLSRNDADHPESWAAFKAWIASVPPEQWAEWAQLPA